MLTCLLSVLWLSPMKGMISMKKEQLCGLVISLKGRDAGELFLAYDKSEEYAMLVDGKRRKLMNPKRKNLRHMRFLPDSEFQTVSGYLEGQLTDAMIRRAIARYKAGKYGKQGGT